MKTNYFLGLSEEGFHKVAYTEWGEPHPSIPPTLCVHGLTRNGRDFDELAAYLSRFGHHVFCPDMVGRGESDWLKNPEHYTYEQYLADMNTLIARINSPEMNWIGTSMGGLIGMFLASMQNSPIRKLVLNDIGPQVSAKGLMRLSKYTGRVPIFANVREATDYFKRIYADFGPLSESEWLNFTERSVRKNASGQYVIKLDPRINTLPTKSKLAWQALLHPFKLWEGTAFDISLWSIWHKVTCPVLLLHGKHSDILLTDTIQKMRSHKVPFDVIEIEDAGHAPALLDPKQHEIIQEWLDK